MAQKKPLRNKGPIIGWTTGLAIIVSSPGAFHGKAADQDAKPSANSGEEVETVVVRGRGSSQRTSMDRKKNAATAVDSIAAEDVGKFPDQNVNEAISRVAGVALDRGDNGEGVGISVRGTTADMTRVDIDGMTVLNTNGALVGGTGAGRRPRGRPARITGRHHQEHRRHTKAPRRP